MIYPWQYKDWSQLYDLRSRWPNVLLLFGQTGIGKLDFAKHLSQSFLCEIPKLNGEPCRCCLSCIWFERGNHFDYRIIMPESLSENPIVYRNFANDDRKKISSISKEIKIDQIRTLIDFCNISSHRGGLRVVVVYPAESMNIIASNAMLKVLEEPPKDVIFILISSKIDGIPQTITSRCLKWPMSAPLIDAASEWLSSKHINDDDTHILLAQAGGAPLLALALANDKNQKLRDFVLIQLSKGAECDPFSCAESLHNLPIPVVLGWLQRWLYDLFSYRIANTLRYFPSYAESISLCADTVNIKKLTSFVKIITCSREIENYPLNAKIMFEEMFFNYRDLFV